VVDFRRIATIHPEPSICQTACAQLLRLIGRPPFCACVRNAEPLSLGVALGFAARLRNYHCQVAAMVKRVAHTLVKERILQF